MKKRLHFEVLGATVLCATAVSGVWISGQEPAASPVRMHIGHVMTSWKDTPNMIGLLPAAVADAKVAAMHAGLAAKTPDNLANLHKLHAGHVLNALDPTIVAKGPGSGFGCGGRGWGVATHPVRRQRCRGVGECENSHRTCLRVARRRREVDRRGHCHRTEDSGGNVARRGVEAGD